MCCIILYCIALYCIVAHHSRRRSAHYSYNIPTWTHYSCSTSHTHYSCTIFRTLNTAVTPCSSPADTIQGLPLRELCQRPLQAFWCRALLGHGMWSQGCRGGPRHHLSYTTWAATFEQHYLSVVRTHHLCYTT